MANPTITNNDIGSVLMNDAEFEDDTLSVSSSTTYKEGTLLGRKVLNDAVTAAANGSNTGDGTVTLSTVADGPIVPLVGAHNLECTSVAVAKGTATATAAAGGSNTGNGTVTALTITADKKGLEPGAYNLEMIELGTKNGVAIGAAVTAGTGNGTVSAVVAGAIAKAGIYVATCTSASVSGSEIFQVIDPDGEILEDLTVAVAYLNSHLGVTLSDGSTDFIVGDTLTITITDTGGLFKLVDPSGSIIDSNIIMDAGALQATAIEVAGIAFTITAGATDFIVGDTFAITVANTVGLWKLVDPNGALIAANIEMAAGALQATAIEVAGLKFTLTDGATDFIVGDKFSLTTVSNGKMVVFEKDGAGGAQIPLAILTYEIITGAVSTIVIRAGIKGTYKKERLVIHSDTDDSNIDSAVRDQLRDYGLVATNVFELNDLDNQ